MTQKKNLVKHDRSASSNERKTTKNASKDQNFPAALGEGFDALCAGFAQIFLSGAEAVSDYNAQRRATRLAHSTQQGRCGERKYLRTKKIK